MPVVMLLRQTQNSMVISKCTLMLLDWLAELEADHFQFILHLKVRLVFTFNIILFNGFWTVVLLQ